MSIILKAFLKIHNLRVGLWSRALRTQHALSAQALSSVNNKVLVQVKRFLSTTSQLFCDEKKREESTKKSTAQKGREHDDSGIESDKNENEDKGNDILHAIRQLFLTGIAFIVTLVLLDHLTSSASNDVLQQAGLVSWYSFKHNMLEKGEVSQIHIIPPSSDPDAVTGDREAVALIYLHPGAIINGKMEMLSPFRSGMSRNQPASYFMQIRDLKKFEEDLRQAEHNLGISPANQIPITYSDMKNSDTVYAIFLLAVLAVILYSASKFKFSIKSATSRGGPGAHNPFDIFGSLTKPKYTMVDKSSAFGTGVSFKDVAGLKEAKVEIKEFVDYLKKPQVYRELGAKVPKGALLTGPPGCGKTLLARATATEANVPFLATAGSEFVEMIGGLGASRVRSLFKEARSKAPCIIYIDEVDAIGKKRNEEGAAGGGGGQANSEEEQTLNQLLVELDGMGTTDGVICLASTNREHVLDKALMRPGRFDRHIYIGIPTLEERREIFEYSLQKLTLKQPASVYSVRLAQLTPGFSGADIANICNVAAIHAGTAGEKVVDTYNFEYAVERIIGGVAKKSSVLMASERRIIAYHESGHALVAWLLPHTDQILKISIVPRTSAALGYTQQLPEDRYLLTNEQLFAKMCVLLGGRVAEQIIFNSFTSGAQNDLEKVTKVAYSQVKHYGMSDVVGPISFPVDTDGEGEYRKKPYSKQLASLLDQEARHLVARAYYRTEQLLKANKDKLDLLAQALLDKEVLNQSELISLLGERPANTDTTTTDTQQKPSHHTTSTQ